MCRSFKIAILWLLVFALPLQGFASSGMLGCAGAHHGMMPGVLQQVGYPPGTEQDHIGQSSSRGFHLDTEKNAHTVAGKAPIENNHHHGSAKCSACTSCCLGTAISLPAGLDPIAPLQVGLELNGQPDGRFTAYFPEGLERPPHTLDS